MIVEKISEKSVRLKVENENNKIANKLKTVFFEDGCIPVSQLEDYEEVPYAIWCNYLPELVPPTEVDRLNQKIKNLEMKTPDIEELQLQVKDINDNLNVIMNSVSTLGVQDSSIIDSMLLAIGELYAMVSILMEEREGGQQI